MRKKIQDMMQGIFETNDSALLLSPSELKFSVIEQEDYQGSFQLRVVGSEPLRGLIACDNDCITCQTKEFRGFQAEIQFTFSAGSLQEGSSERGQFIITTNTGEYLLPFTATVTRNYIASSIGKIKTLNDFTNLCKLNLKEALHVFSDARFPEILRQEDRRFVLLYRGLTAHGHNAHTLEEFLVGVGKKHRVEFQLEEKEKEVSTVKEPAEHFVMIRKSDWGDLDLHIACDAPFLSLSRTQMHGSDFTGKHALFSYKILPRHLHAGKNFARIQFSTAFQKEEYIITVDQSQGSPEYSAEKKKRMLRCRLEQCYMNWKLGTMDIDSWREESLRLIRRTQEVSPNNQWDTLFAAYIFLVCDMQEEADLEVVKLQKTLRSQKSPMGAFYLYLTTFGEEESYKKDVTLRVRDIYLKYPSHPIINWVLLQMDDSLLRNNERKYNVIKKYMTEYSLSPIFYYEAAQLLISDPMLLYKQERYETNLISWMSRKNLITEQLALRVQQMSLGKRKFEQNFFAVMTKCQKKYPDDAMIKAICVYLIRLSRYGEVYFPWFKRGLEQHLKIAGLYEAYMLSRTHADGEIPVEVIKYFSMNSSLPSRRKAMLYAYVVRNRERLGKDWDIYINLIHTFVFQELDKGHMNDDLATICETIREVVDEEEWDLHRDAIQNCYKLFAHGNGISNVWLLQKNPEFSMQRVLLSQGETYLQLHPEEDILLLEDSYGMLYCADGNYRIHKMLSGTEKRKEPVPAQSDESVQEPSKPENLRILEKLEKGNLSMKDFAVLIRTAEERGMQVLKFKEQLMIRMLFTGQLVADHDLYFMDILKDEEALQLQLAYIAFISRENMLSDEPLTDRIFNYIGSVLESGHQVNLYSRAAFLRYFAEHPTAGYGEIAEQVLRTYLLNGIYFDFYESLPMQLLRKYLIFNLKIITFRAAQHHTLIIQFSTGHREVLPEVLPGIYSIAFHMYVGEEESYQILTKDGDYLFSQTMQMNVATEGLEHTRYAKISELAMGELNTNLQFQYAELDDISNQLFQPIKE